MPRHTAFVLAASMALAAPTMAEVKTQAIDYKQGDTVLQGFLAWDDAKPGKRPGVLVVHEWWGHNEHARNQAKRLDEAGYVAFALDMYGKGKVTTHPKEARPHGAPSAGRGVQQEMTAAGAKFEVIVYPRAKHGFTNPDADKMGMEGLAYNAAADKQSWAAAMKLLGEVFP